MATTGLIYCLKCREHTASVEVEVVTTRAGKPATKARCAVCGGGKYLFGIPTWLQQDHQNGG